MENKSLQLNPSLKAHLFLGVGLGLWLVFFLIFIAPFDTSELEFRSKFEILPVYGVLVFIAYAIVVWLQNWIYQRSQDWNLGKEILMFCLFFVLVLVLIYPYYKSDIVNGDFGFSKFFLIIYLPTTVILSAFLISGRLYLNKLHKKSMIGKVVLKGDNKGDLLQVKPEDILCISSAQNYVEVHYLVNSQVQKKLLRTTLKTVTTDLPDVFQVHRSHFINPAHFVKWKDSNTALVRDLEIPVSKKFKDPLEVLLKSSLGG